MRKKKNYSGGGPVIRRIDTDVALQVKQFPMAGENQNPRYRVIEGYLPTLGCHKGFVSNKPREYELTLPSGDRLFFEARCFLTKEIAPIEVGDLIYGKYNFHLTEKELMVQPAPI